MPASPYYNRLMSYRRTIFSFAFGFLLMSMLPAHAFAAATFEVTGWLPYWRGATSTNDVIPHLGELTEVDLFAYSLKNDGTLRDNAGLDKAPWTTLIADAKAQHVRVVVTVMTSNTSLIHSLLSNTRSRIALESTITNMVKTNGYDGVDIDFEGKAAEDKNYFSTFLKGLYQRMGSKWVMCDIEARTPVDARYYGTTVPPDATIYANDFTQINKYCDRVRFMTYDQQGVDQSLAAAAASSSELYAPVADPLWVKKVIQLAEQSISPSKISIGVPTYGYEYNVTAYAGGQYTYDILDVFNPGYATQIMQQYGVGPPARNIAGEMQLTFPEATSSAPMTLSQQVGALVAATAASAYADALNSHQTFRLLDWPDAQSIAGKASLAQMLGVRGISIFKLDGGEDPNMWTALLGVKGSAFGDGGGPTSGAAAGSTSVSRAPLSRTLTLGSTGEDVRTLQMILNASADTAVAASGPGSSGQETTRFGPATLAAVKAFQSKYGIATAKNPAYGTVGPATRTKLNALLASL